MSAENKWYSFYDVCSGSFRKTAYAVILIEAEHEVQAIEVFEDTFNLNPENITCVCCGPDYAIREVESIEAGLRILGSQGHRRVIRRSEWEEEVPF
jgi:hypothetical protein